MALPPAITELERLRDRPELAKLLAWRASAVTGAKLDREELSIDIGRGAIRDVSAFLRDDSELRFNFLSDITCVDWYPNEPRFQLAYHLLSIPRRVRLRLKVKLSGDDARVQSVTSVWPAGSFFEREVFDLFGVHFEDHPYLRRLLMPENWEGHPLRKDYPVEGYR